MTQTGGRVAHLKARALSELIRVTPRLAAPAGCARHHKANARLRFRGARCRPCLQSHARCAVSFASSRRTSPAHRCDARLLRASNIEQQLRARIFRFRVFRAAPCSRIKKLRERAQLRFASSRRILPRGRVVRSAVTPNGSCELRHSPRFSLAKMRRSIDATVANVRRECSRADSLLP
jgi:hypothetical protein